MARVVVLLGCAALSHATIPGPYRLLRLQLIEEKRVLHDTLQGMVDKVLLEPLVFARRFDLFGGLKAGCRAEVRRCSVTRVLTLHRVACALWLILSRDDHS